MGTRAGDHSGEFAEELAGRIGVALEACGLLVEATAAMRCPVRTGWLKGSITHEAVDARTMAVGTNVEYAQFVELGAAGRAHVLPRQRKGPPRRTAPTRALARVRVIQPRRGRSA